MKEEIMNQDEIDLITTKMFTAPIFLIVFFIIFVGISSLLSYIFFDGYLSFIGLVVSLFIFILILYLAWKKIKKSKIDLTEKKKVIETFTIINKRFDDDAYCIFFNSKVIKKYVLSKENYYAVEINDSIDIEYTKHAHWILKLEHSGKNIINRNMM